MVCCVRDFLVVWTIVLAWRRRDSELLYDRARSRRLRALVRRAICFCLVSLRGSVARGYSGGRGGLTRCEPRDTAASLLLRPHAAASTPSRSLPARHTEGAAVARKSARVSESAHDRSAIESSRIIDAVGPCHPHSRRVHATSRAARSDGVSSMDARGGSERSARRSPARSKRLARSARLAACKRKGDEEWNARDRPARTTSRDEEWDARDRPARNSTMTRPLHAGLEHDVRLRRAGEHQPRRPLRGPRGESGRRGRRVREIDDVQRLRLLPSPSPHRTRPAGRRADTATRDATAWRAFSRALRRSARCRPDRPSRRSRVTRGRAP